MTILSKVIMKFLNLIFSLALVIFPINSIAGTCIPDHCADVYVDRLYVESSGTIYVGTSGDEKVLNCQAVAGEFATIPADAVGADRVYSILIAAQAANKPLSILQVDDNKPGCVIQYVTLDRE